MARGNSPVQEEAAVEKAKLRRAMGFSDLVLFYIAAIVGLRWVANASTLGPSALFAWLIAFGGLFIPLAFAVTELSSRYPEEGGIYVWSKRAFGDFHGFMTGYTYWTSQLVYFPSLLVYAASNAAYVIPRYSDLAKDKTYLGVFSIIGLSIALLLNMVGLNIGKWLHNASATLGTWLPALMLITIGVLAWLRFGSATEFTAPSLVPSITSISEIVLWSNLAFAFAGLEAASVMGEEVREPKRNIPRAIVTAGFMITFIYLVGTLCLLFALPTEQTSGLTGIQDAVKASGERVAGPGFGAGAGSLVALLQVVGYIGGVGAWIAASARLPFVAGIDRYLPRAFGKVHPKWGTPYIALLVQAGFTVLFIVMAQWAGETAERAYNILIKLSTITYFIPYLYLFLCFLVLQREPPGEGVIKAPGGRAGGYGAGSIGFLVTLGAIVLACIPEKGEQNPTMFFVAIFGTVGVNLLVGLLLYAGGKLRRRRL